MWILQRISDETILHKLIVGKNYVIGRKSSEADIVVPNDASVSRKHATLTVNHSMENLKYISKQSFITIEDSSKYGTFHMTKTEEKLTPGSTKHFKHGDKIRFGGQNSIYQFLHCSVVVTTSMVDRATKDKVSKIVYTLAGHYMNHWDEAITHLVMSSIKLSFKVIQALINGSHIVTPEYFYALHDNINANSDIDCSNFLPKLDEPSLSVPEIEFNIKPERRTLFANKNFVFLNLKQMNKFKAALESSGAKVLPFTNVGKLVLHSKNTCVIDCGKEIDNAVANEEQIRQCKINLALKGMRFIQEHEIGLSVVYCCTDVYCNPCFDLSTQNMFTQSSLMHDNSMPSLPAADMAVNSGNGRSASKRARSNTNEEPVVEKRQKMLNSSPIHKSINLSVDDNKNKTDLPTETNVEKNGDVRNSCLDDDNLWSQNIAEDNAEVLKRTTTAPTKVRISNQSTEVEKMEAKHEHVTPTLKSPFQNVVAHNTDSNNTAKQETAPNRFDIQVDVSVKMQVVVQSLIVKKKPSSQGSNNEDGLTVKNFKKFKKVFPTYMLKNLPERHLHSEVAENNYSIPPQIIGGSDLIVCSENTNSDKRGDIYKWMSENQSIQESQDSNPFMNL